jgi:hypothetical protein
VHSSFLVTHPVAQTSLCASSPDASPATLAPERYFPAPGSSFGFPLWPAIGAAQRLGNLATLWLRTMALAATITEIWKEQLTTMQTFALCASLHWQTATLPPKLKETLPPRSKNHPPSNLKNPRTTRRKKSAVLKLLKKISARPNVIFKPADLHDFQIAADTVKPLFLIEVVSFDWNDPQYITPRYIPPENSGAGRSHYNYASPNLRRNCEPRYGCWNANGNPVSGGSVREFGEPLHSYRFKHVRIAKENPAAVRLFAED